MKLFIGCGSSDDIPDYYFNECELLLNKLLLNNDLIYGAYNKGIMNIAYNVAKKNNRYIIGIAPKQYENDLNLLNIDEKILVDNIEQRTHELITRSDAIIFLPGGLGTINEIFSAIDSKRSGEFDKTIIIYNINHYYDKLIEFLERLYNDRFSELDDKESYYVTNNCDKVLKLLNKEV